MFWKINLRRIYSIHFNIIKLIISGQWTVKIAFFLLLELFVSVRRVIRCFQSENTMDKLHLNWLKFQNII